MCVVVAVIIIIILILTTIISTTGNPEASVKKIKLVHDEEMDIAQTGKCMYIYVCMCVYVCV